MIAPSKSTAMDTSSQLLISGVPESVTANLLSEDIISQLFRKLNISKLESDGLSIRETHGQTKD